MAGHGKKYQDAVKKVDETREYAADEALALIKDIAFANFDETVEVHARLGVDPRQAEQSVRTTVTLPHGTGKGVRVLVFAAGEGERAGGDQPHPQISSVAMTWFRRSIADGSSSTRQSRWRTRWARSVAWARFSGGGA